MKRYDIVKDSTTGKYELKQVELADITSAFLADGMTSIFNESVGKDCELLQYVVHTNALYREEKKLLKVTEEEERKRLQAEHESHKKAVSELREHVNGRKYANTVSLLTAYALVKPAGKDVKFSGMEELVDVVRNAYDTGINKTSAGKVKTAVCEFFEKYGMKKDTCFKDISICSKVALMPAKDVRKYTIAELVNSIGTYELTASHGKDSFDIKARRKTADKAFQQIVLLVLSGIFGLSIENGKKAGIAPVIIG